MQAQAKFIRISAKKANRVLKLVNKMDVTSALTLLKLLPHNGARIVASVVMSAVKNAENNNRMDVKNLFIKDAYSGPCGILKRFHPMSRGRAGAIEKRLSHITIKVSEKGSV